MLGGDMVQDGNTLSLMERLVLHIGPYIQVLSDTFVT